MIENVKRRLWEIIAVGGFFAIVWIGWEVRDYFGKNDINLAVAEAKTKTESEMRSQFVTELALAKEKAYESGKEEGQEELRQQLEDRLQDKADLAYLIGIVIDPQIYDKLPVDGRELVDRTAQSVKDSGLSIPKSALPVDIVGMANCIGLNEVAALRKSEVYDQCETTAEVAFTSFVENRSPGLANFRVNGDPEQAKPGDTISITENCWLTYIRIEEVGGLKQPAVRFLCN